jgi:iron complex outermembrane receptor protein
MNGTSDVSLIQPYSIIQSNSIKYGSNQSLGANNNVAGSLIQNSFYLSNTGLDVTLALHQGSFQKSQQYIGLKNTGYKTLLGVDFFHESALNNFGYKTEASLPKFNKKNIHSKNEIYQINGILQHNINSYTQIQVAINYTDANRQIAPSIHESANDATQIDKQLRSYISAIYKRPRYKLELKNAYVFEYLDYTKKSADILSISKLHKNITQFNYEKEFIKKHRHTIFIKVENNFSIASNSAFDKKNPTQNIANILANYKFSTRKLDLLVSANQQLINTKIAPFLFDVSASYKIHKNFFISGKAGRIYRYPTLNDLYWSQGGNKDLLPEKGWTAEYSVFFKASKNRFYFDTKATNFYYWINNWIQWTPTNLAYWTPKNTKKVFSRGIEVQSQVKYETRNILINLASGYSYILPTQVSDGELFGKQLIYETRHKTFINLTTSIYHVLLSYSFQYTGSRYTSTDNSYSLAPFNISDIRVAYDINKKQMHLEPYFSIQNITNTNYQMMQGRPMMGRNYMCGIIFSIHQNPRNEK